MREKVIQLPLEEKMLLSLKAGDMVFLTGKVYTARDAAHEKIFQCIKKGEKLPFDLKNAIIYYTGPTPAKPGYVTGSAGPTTSSRMDIWTPELLKNGLKGMIGKGRRSSEVVSAIKKYRAVYFSTIGGAGALLSKKIISSKIIAYKELGPEAVYELFVRDFPVIVINDCYGRDFFDMRAKVC